MALFKRKNKEDGQKFKSLLNTPRLDLRHSIPSAIAKVKALNAPLWSFYLKSQARNLWRLTDPFRAKMWQPSFTWKRMKN